MTRARFGRSPVAVTIYLGGFVVLLLGLAKFYLIPAMVAFGNADAAHRKVLGAYALLVLSLVLLLLFLGLLFTFRIGRFFKPRTTLRSPPTKYVDAWSESGRRLKMPDKHE